jgi:hypothetical protein
MTLSAVHFQRCALRQVGDHDKATVYNQWIPQKFLHSESFTTWGPDFGQARGSVADRDPQDLRWESNCGGSLGGQK